jgi:RNA polymerase sigma-70 factor (ECF subfamily)
MSGARDEAKVVPFGNPRAAERPRDVGQAAAGATRMRMEQSEPDDREALARAARGDDAAVRLLYRRYVDRVYRHVARMLGPDDGDIEDVVQQVFLAALDGAGRFDGRSSVSTWLLGIASRRALDEARARARRERWSRITERIGVGRPAGRPDVQHGAAYEAHSALTQIKPEQRHVFVLHDVEGHTLAEIREMTGTGISTLHARLQAARRRLKRIARSELTEGSQGEEDGSVA